MLGQSSAPKARYKGGGDGDVGGVCQGPREAARCMLGCRCAGWHAGHHAASLEELVDQVKRAFVLRPLAGIRGPPKWHLMLHIGARARFSGNPQFHTTFLDED